MSTPPTQFYRPDQSPPVAVDPDVDAVDTSRGVVFGADGVAAHCLQNRWLGASVFLVCGGPSLEWSPLSLLDRRGVIVAAVNNVAATVVRPQLWFSCDVQHHFHETIWRDPGVMKFTKLKYTSERHKWAGSKPARPPYIHRWNGTAFEPTNDTPARCPNVWGYLHAHFKMQPWRPETYWHNPLPSWGSNTVENDPDGKSWHKSVLLVTLWLLRWLGFRTIYLIGCDFAMRPEKPYAFPETSREGTNNDLYRWLNRRFTELAPHNADAGMTVVNCTPGGGLTAFPRLTLEEAVQRATALLPRDVVTLGHYRG